MLSINDLKNKMIVLIEDEPYQILEVKHLHVGRGGSSIQTRIRHLKTGQVFSRNFKPADTFEEADVEKRELVYLYGHRGQHMFAAKGNPAERSSLSDEQVGDALKWLKPNTPVSATILAGELVGISLPIKMDFEVKEAPPGIKGDTAGAATKTVSLETGAVIQTPLFVNAGDIVRVNTETGEYVGRVSKG